MKSINDYKRRFDILLESTIGNVKPLIVEQALPLPPKFSDSKTGAYFALLQSGNWNPAINSNLFPFSAGTYTLIPATEDPNGLNSSAFLVDSKGEFTGYMLFFRYYQKEKALPTQLTIAQGGSPELVGDVWTNVKYVLEIANNTYPKDTTMPPNIR